MKEERETAEEIEQLKHESMRKRKLQISQNIRSRLASKEQSWKIRKAYLRITTTKKTSLNHRNLIKGNKCQDRPHYNILWIILKIEEGGTRIDETRNQEIDDDAQGVTPKIWHWKIRWVKKNKKQEETEHVSILVYFDATICCLLTIDRAVNWRFLWTARTYVNKRNESRGWSSEFESYGYSFHTVTLHPHPHYILDQSSNHSTS